MFPYSHSFALLITFNVMKVNVATLLIASLSTLIAHAAKPTKRSKRQSLRSPPTKFGGNGRKLTFDATCPPLIEETGKTSKTSKSMKASKMEKRCLMYDGATLSEPECCCNLVDDFYNTCPDNIEAFLSLLGCDAIGDSVCATLLGDESDYRVTCNCPDPDDSDATGCWDGEFCSSFEGCMSGNLLLQQPGDSTGIESSCTIVTIGSWGKGLLFGNYTHDHLILTNGQVDEHGQVGDETFEDMFMPLSDCPFILDHTGIPMTTLDGFALGDNIKTPISVEEYVGMYTIQTAFVEFAPEIMSRNAYNFTNIGLGNSLGYYPLFQAFQSCIDDETTCVEAYGLSLIGLQNYKDEVRAKLFGLFTGIDPTNPDPSTLQSILISILG